MARSRRFGLSILVVVAWLLSASCALPDTGPDVPVEEDMETYVISNTTQLRYDGNLWMGVGNFWREEYVGQDGETREGLTAGLWLLDPENPASQQHVRVHVGQEVVYDRYRIRIVEIGKGRRDLYVQVAIGPAQESQD